MRWWCLLLLLIGVAHAGAYRWTDADGKVHYSDKPPPDSQVQSEQIEVKGPDRIGQGREVKAIHERTRRLREAEEDARREKRQEQAQRQQQADKLARRCQQAKRRLKRLSGPFIYRDSEGKAYTVSEEQAEQDREEVRLWIAEHCS